MTNEQAGVVAKIIQTADGGCPYCADNLAERLMAALPEVDWMTALAIAGVDERRLDNLKPYVGDWSEA